MRRPLLATLMLLSSFSCATQSASRPALLPAARSVTVLTDAAAQCELVGEVRGSSCAEDFAGAMDSAKDDMRNKTIALKGDSVQIVTNESTGCTRFIQPGTQVQLTGKAYRCAPVLVAAADTGTATDASPAAPAPTTPKAATPPAEAAAPVPAPPAAPAKKCIASELPEWKGADAVTKKALLAKCRADAK